MCRYIFYIQKKSIHRYIISATNEHVGTYLPAVYNIWVAFKYSTGDILPAEISSRKYVLVNLITLLLAQ